MLLQERYLETKAQALCRRLLWQNSIREGPNFEKLFSGMGEIYFLLGNSIAKHFDGGRNIEKGRPIFSDSFSLHLQSITSDDPYKQMRSNPKLAIHDILMEPFSMKRL